MKLVARWTAPSPGSMIDVMLRWIAAGALAFAIAGCSGDGGGIVRVDGAGYFNPTALDFGTQPIAVPAKKMVRFSNASAGEAKVTEIAYEPTTNAFGVKLAEGGAFRNTTLGAGGGTDLEVTFAPDREGAFDVVMLVRTESLEIPLELTGSGRSVEPARFVANPTSVSFSDVVVGGEATQPMMVTNMGEVAGAILRSPSMGPFSIHGAGGGNVPNTDIEPGDSAALEIRFRPSTPGTFEETLFIEATNGERTEIMVRGTAVAAGALTCDATSIDLGDVVRGMTARRTVTCTTDGGYTVESIDPGHPELAVENVSPAIGAAVQTLTFDVVYAARGIAHTVAGTLTIRPTIGAPTTIDVTAATIAPPASAVDLQVAVSWSTSVDLDIHFVRDGGLPFMAENDCHYEAPTIDWNVMGDESDDPFLDGDLTSGPATERVSMQFGRAGTYHVYVILMNYVGAMVPPTDATATIHLRGQTDTVVTNTLAACGQLWHVGTIHHGANPPRFDTVNTFSSAYEQLADCF